MSAVLCPSHVVVLAGQSNMAGRGDVDQLTDADLRQHRLTIADPSETTPLDMHDLDVVSLEQVEVISSAEQDGTESPSTGCKHRWIPAQVPLHREADGEKMRLLSQAKSRRPVGLGCGIPFANLMLRSAALQSKDSDSPIYRPRIGLIPCAVGATSMSVWAPPDGVLFRNMLERISSALNGSACPREYLHPVQSHSMQAMTPAGYNAQGFMLMFARFASAFLPHCYTCFLDNICPFTIDTPRCQQPSVIALVYYQGESDATDIEVAQAYELHLRNLIAKARQHFESLVLPQALPQPVGVDRVGNNGEVTVLLVRVTGSRQRLPHLDLVRCAQERVASDTSKVSLIDVDDCSMKQDGIHLDTNGQLALAKRLYLTLEQAYTCDSSYS